MNEAVSTTSISTVSWAAARRGCATIHRTYRGLPAHLEMASNLYETPGEMLERIHVAAPRAAVAFINWGCSPRARIDDTTESSQQAASAAHVDVLNGAALLHDRTRRPHSMAPLLWATWT